MENVSIKELYFMTESLIEDELFFSAKIYASLLLSLLRKKPQASTKEDFTILLKTTFWYGKCCCIDLEYERANVYFTAAIHLLRHTLNEDFATFQKYTYIYDHAMDVKEKLNRGHEISELLIDIPPSVLPSKWHSKLVKFGNKEQRKHSQNAIFLKHPSALEHVDKTLNSTFNLDSSPSWWASLIRSYHHDSFFENTEALKQLSDFSLKFPDAVETLLYEAKYHVFDLNFKAARSIFQKIQLIDPWVLQYMDMYAFTLMELDELDTMNRVVNDLFALYPQCKEPYVAVALKFVAERDLSKINCLLDKANSLDASHFMTQFVRGRVFFVQKEFDKAFNLFYELYLMGNRIPLIFYNLIHASMAAKNGTQDILNLAHVALEVHPQNVPLLSIIGKYLASYGSVKDKKRAVILLKQSLDNNPQLTSIEALVSLYLSEKVYPSALEIINKYTSNLPAEFGHLQRAYFYMNIDDMNSAFSSINQALIANPNSKRALDLHNNLISRCG